MPQPPDFYPRPPRGGRRSYWIPAFGYGFISIHALREEGDARFARACACTVIISIHALREEGDESVRFYRLSWCDFYPRPPRGGRLIHNGKNWRSHAFLSTPSARRATRFGLCAALPVHISIHALREEGDQCGLTSMPQPPDFYPRPPRGGRRSYWIPAFGYGFISIHALREEGDARFARACACTVIISIHALREEGDESVRFYRLSWCDFYPRPPRGGRLIHNGKNWRSHAFLSTPSARRATAIFFYLTMRCLDFYPRPPRGGRQQKQRQNLYFQTNYTTFCTNLEEP